MNEKEIIVALELGSQTVRAIAGSRQADGSFHVERIEQVPADGCIRRGTVYNLDKTVGAIRRVVDMLQSSLGVSINKAYVGIQGQSLHTEHNFIQRHLADHRVKVDNDTIEQLLAANTETRYPSMEILEVVTQEYKLESPDSTTEEADPVGIETQNIEGRYVNVVARASVKSNILKCVTQAGLEPIGHFVTPLVLAELMVPESERRGGCALVDMGAETTTVMVFTRNILRHMAVIPLGGRNITKDITTMQVEMDNAENFKKGNGRAITLPTSEADASQGGLLDSAKLQRIIEARMEEILRNVIHQIELSRVDDKLQAGIIFTGGAANMPDLCAAFTKFAAGHDFKKVRVAKSLLADAEQVMRAGGLADANYNSLYALLTRGETDCTLPPEPEPVMEQGQLLFDNEEEEPAPAPAEPAPVQPVVEEKPVEEEKPQKPKGPSKFKRFWQKLVDSLEEPENK